MNERPWETRDGRIWIGDRWASPKEVADLARVLSAERDKANAEADRLAEELLVARGEVARLRMAAREFAAARQAHRAAFDQVAPDHVLAAAKARLAAAESALILTLDTPAREGGAA